jgi:phosphoribosylformimino-5-aminoimidazole carboxamide ribotide isomerase
MPRRDRAPNIAVASPFGQAGDPGASFAVSCRHRLVRSLYCGSDAITGRLEFRSARGLGYALPGVTLWIDAGFSGVDDCGFWLPLDATLVIGSESVKTAGNWREIKQAFGQTTVLSLDFDAEGPRGPAALFADPDLWPDRIIVMNLGRVGLGRA